MPAFSDLELSTLSRAERRYYLQRREFLQTALEDILIHEREMKRALSEGRPFWIDSFAPLHPKERSAVINEARKWWGIPCPHKTTVTEKDGTKRCGDCDSPLR